MTRPLIRRLPRTDHASDHFLLNIQQNGPDVLDLKIVGTDQEHLFHGSIVHDSIVLLRASNYHGDSREWTAILSYALLHKKADDLAADAVQNLEVVSVIKDSTATITVRRRGKGLVQRLGEIKLQQDDEREEVAAFDWVDAAVETSDELRHTCDELQSSLDAQKVELGRLNTQLDELIQAKKDHDEELLSKFAALLNAKKLKIRDQQRLLTGMSLESDIKPETVSVPAQPARKAGRSRGAKRKARGPTQEESDDEAMEDVMVPNSFPDRGGDEDDVDPVATPDASEDETDDELAIEYERERGSPAAADPSQAQAEEQAPIKQVKEPPPRRPLPFRKRSTRSGKDASTRPEAQDIGDKDIEDDETDDEL